MISITRPDDSEERPTQFGHLNPLELGSQEHERHRQRVQSIATLVKPSHDGAVDAHLHRPSVNKKTIALSECFVRPIATGEDDVRYAAADAIWSVGYINSFHWSNSLAEVLLIIEEMSLVNRLWSKVHFSRDMIDTIGPVKKNWRYCIKRLPVNHPYKLYNTSERAVSVSKKP